MGIFNPKKNNPDEELCNRLCAVLEADKTSKNKALAAEIRARLNQPERGVIKPYSLFLQVVAEVIGNTVNFKQETWHDSVRYGELIYPHMFPLGENTPGFDTLASVFLGMFDVNNVVAGKMFIPKLFHLFGDKVNYIRWMKVFENSTITSARKGIIAEYALRIRSFCMDEDVFTASLIRFTERLLGGEDAKTIAEQEYVTLCRMCGVYNVSEERIMLAEQKIDAVQTATNKLQNSLELSEERAKLLNGLSERITNDVQKFCNDELTKVKTTITNLKEDMNKAHASFVETQRRAVLGDKDELVNSVIEESQNGIRELKKQADTILADARRDILRVNRESSDVIERVDKYMNNNDRLKDLLGDEEFSSKLNEKIDHLMEMYEEAIQKGVLQQTIAPAPQSAPAPRPVKRIAGAPEYEPAPPAPQAPPEGMPPMPFPDDMPAPPQRLDWTIPVEYVPSVVLDERVLFADRYALAMKRKKEMEQQGVHFHKMFDDVLIAVIENANPYLIGPSGCGKTYMVQQISEILDVEAIDIGYINEEYDILGFQTANGGYSCPNFYRCYKYGKIAFCDELDNGNSRATVKLNSFLSNTTNGEYNFPHGERVPRHPNFRIIAAGNTTGNGADANYNTREKIEESVQQRFTPIFVGYDNEVEKSILGPYTQWYRFVVLFRDATTEWSRLSRAGAPGIITTRDVTRIRKYLDNHSFSDEKIIEYEFVQTKDPEYLTFLTKELAKELNREKTNAATNELIRKFALRSAEIRDGKDPDRVF